ncbi:MAG: hypothetical protein ACQERD_01090 [Campylobacterota bacterium]
MYKTIIFSLVSFSFIACSQTTALKHFQTQTSKARATQDTQKIDIIENNEVKALFWATYLNNIKKSQDHRFLLSIYFTNDYKDEYKNISTKKFLLNEQKAKTLKQIDGDKFSSILQNRPWAKHYIVSFEKQKNSIDFLDLNFINNSNPVSLRFQK